MRLIQNIFKSCRKGLLKTVGENVKKAVISIQNCRTEKMKTRVSACGDCGHKEHTYCSCKNRNCPICQTFEKEKWIVKKKQDLINTRYFHTVFTLPHDLNGIIKYNPRTIYNLLFHSVSETLIELGYDKRHVGAQVGAIMVLHTWCQKLNLHAHIHCIIPGGGLINGKWVECKKDIFIHVDVLSSVFRKKFLRKFESLVNENKLEFPDEVKQLYTKSKLLKLKRALNKKDWYVYNQKVFSTPDAVIEYLGRYTHKIAITNNRILKFENGLVTFKYRDNKDGGREKELTLSAEKFINRYIQHVLPTGFMKIRYIGILSNANKKTKLLACKILTRTAQNVENFTQVTAESILKKITNGKYNLCPACGSSNYRLTQTLYPGDIKNST